ncbi:MAG: hypothetical protein JNL64_08180 [Blastocatellia bacterium]|nr:hypothetical protein [Blastocatellia bacterium]
MNLREKFIPQKCYLRSECRTDADTKSIKKLFDKDWQVYAFSLDPVSGKYISMTLCCDAALPSPLTAGNGSER